MGRCQRCGADALDFNGMCRNCGWRAPVNAFDDDAPSLGETRAADTALQPAPEPRYPASGYQGPPSGAMSSPPLARAPRSGPGGPTDGSSPRYCGVCGARIMGTEAFCGQCGSPVTGTHTARTGSQPGPSRYQVGPVSGWNTSDGDAYTEALPEPPGLAAARNPYMNDPHARSYAPSYGPSQSAAGGTSRTSRIMIGVFFLAASVITAIIAITLAVMWFS